MLNSMLLALGSTWVTTNLSRSFEGGRLQIYQLMELRFYDLSYNHLRDEN